MIVDCCLLFDELDLLELRLHELADVVDRFVIVESRYTFTGEPKECILDSELERFSAFKSKLCRIILEELPSMEKGAAAYWERESKQRNAILRGLVDAVAEDVVIVSDCDEIPSAYAVAQFDKTSGLARLKQKTFYYNFNWMLDYGNEAASGCRIGTFGQMVQLGGPQAFRHYRRYDLDLPAIENGGWHCSYFGGSLERIRRKCRAFAHAHEFLLGDDLDLIYRIATGKDIHSRSNLPSQMTWCDIDESYPQYFSLNRSRFAHFTNDYFVSRYVLTMTSEDG
jgi:beta-1,4-mannosyl-glycoprotein beta-1,4-N-acetylglucosaminyltransferase